MCEAGEEKAAGGDRKAKRNAEGSGQRKRGTTGRAERERESRARTWRFIRDLWENDRALLHAHLLDKGVEHEDDRNGILSATNLRVARAYKPGRRDTRAGFRRYYLESIDSEITDRWRKVGRRFVRCDEEKLVVLSARIQANFPSPEDMMIAREDRAVRKALFERPRVAIRALPWRQSAALMLWLEDPQPKASEIALALGTTEGAVYQLLSRGRSRLREVLLGEDDANHDA